MDESTFNVFQTMASEPVSTPQDATSDTQDLEEPFSPGTPRVLFTGLLIAVVSITTPLFAVISDRGPLPSRLIPTALDRDGSASPVPLTVLRSDQSPGGNPRWEPQ